MNISYKHISVPLQTNRGSCAGAAPLGRRTHACFGRRVSFGVREGRGAREGGAAMGLFKMGSITG